MALAAATILAAARPSHAAEVRVTPDRPDLTDSAETVPPGLVQLEAGSTFLRDSAGERPLRRLALGGLLRVGLAETLEARLGSDVFVRDRGEGAGTSGVGDTTVGAKWHLVDEGEWRPALALLPSVKLPTASRGKGLGSGRVDFGGVLAVGKDLPANLHVDINVGLAAVSLSESPGGLFLQKLATGSFSWALADRLFPYWEIFYQSRESPDGRHRVGTDFGVVLELTRRVAVDLSSEFRVAGGNPDWAVRAGFSVLLGRLPEGGATSRPSPSPPSSLRAGGSGDISGGHVSPRSGAFGRVPGGTP